MVVNPCRPIRAGCTSLIYGGDIPFSESNLVYIHNADLADVLGNLVHRATNLCAKNCGGAVPDCAVDKVVDVSALRVVTSQAMSAFSLQTACELAIGKAVQA